MQNGLTESFNGRFRDAFLNEVLFSTLTDAHTQIATGKKDYNRQRPHSALGNIPLIEYAMKTRLEMLAALAQKSTQGLSPTPEGKQGSGQPNTT
jgi:putative transposase